MALKLGIVAFWKNYDRKAVLRASRTAEELGFFSPWADAALAPFSWISAASNVHTRWYFMRTHLADAITVTSTDLAQRFGGTWLPHARAEDDLLEVSTGLSPHPLVMFVGTPRRHKGLADLVQAFRGVRTTGAEADLHYRPIASVRLSAGVGYNDARYESFRNAACPPELDNQESCDFSGERVAGAPPLTLNGSFEYDAPIGTGAYRLRTLLDYSHADGYRAELSRSTEVGARDLVNLRAGIGAADDRWTLTFWADNLFDETYYSGMAVVGPAGTGVAIGLLGAPRTLGLSLELRY